MKLFLYTILSGFVFAIIMGIFSLILNLVKYIFARNVPRTFDNIPLSASYNIFLIFVLIFSQICFAFWSATIVEFAKIGGKYLIFILFFPFFSWMKVILNEHSNLTHTIRNTENHEQEISAALLNGTGTGMISYWVFYFWENLNNSLFFDLPLEIVNWLV